MAVTKYSYTISTGFSAAKIDKAALIAEVAASSIATALLSVDEDGDTCDLRFADALSAGDKTTLDNDASPPTTGSVIGDHLGVKAKVFLHLLHLVLPEEVVGAGASKAIVNDRPAITLQNAQDAYGAVAFVWPEAVNARAEVRVRVTFILDAAGTGSDIVIEGKIKAESPGDDTGTAFSTTATATKAINHTNPGDAFRTDLTVSAAAFDKGDSVALQIGRKGADAADDVNVAIHMLAVEGEIFA